MFKPAREYTVKCVEAYLKCSSQKGTPGIGLVFEHVEEGRIEHTLWLSDLTFKNVDATLREAFGIAEETLKRPGFFTSVGTYLINKEVLITTKIERYNEKDQIRVQWINAVGATAQKSPADIAKQAAALWGERTRKPYERTATGPAEAPEITDEDVPF